MTSQPKFELVFDSRTKARLLVLSPLFLRELFVRAPLELPGQTGCWWVRPVVYHANHRLTLIDNDVIRLW